MITALWAMTIALTILILACVIRSIIGPRNTDRVLAVNMVGSLGNAIIAILATIYQQNFLADVAILYALLSFTAVLVMSRIMRGVKRESVEVAEAKEAEK